MMFPQEEGGQGLPNSVSVGAGDWFYHNFAFAAYPFAVAGAAHLILTYGNETQKRKYMDKMVQGIWGGTSETAPIATALAQKGYRVLVSLATDVPLETGAGTHSNIEVRKGPLDSKGLVSLIRRRGILLVIDATHPYAVSIRTAAREAALHSGIPYFTYIRPEGVADEKDITFVIDHEEAARKAFADGRPVFLTTGGKNLEPYTRAAACANVPLIVRVLPNPDLLRACSTLGIPKENIITARGPFSLEENREVIRKFQSCVVSHKNLKYRRSAGIEGSDRPVCTWATDPQAAMIHIHQGSKTPLPGTVNRPSRVENRFSRAFLIHFYSILVSAYMQSNK